MRYLAVILLVLALIWPPAITNVTATWLYPGRVRLDWQEDSAANLCIERHTAGGARWIVLCQDFAVGQDTLVFDPADGNYQPAAGDRWCVGMTCAPLFVRVELPIVNQSPSPARAANIRALLACCVDDGSIQPFSNQIPTHR